MPFTLEVLPAMIGFPKEISTDLNALDQFADQYANFLVNLGPLNPRALSGDIHAAVQQILNAAVRCGLKIDLDVLQEFLHHPSRWVDIQSVELKVAPAFDKNLNLFKPEDHKRLDELTGLTNYPAHHDPSVNPFPGSTNFEFDLNYTPDWTPSTVVQALNVVGHFTPIVTNAFDDGTFPAASNTITMTRLLLLDGLMLNQVLSDNLGGSNITFYRTNDNIMIAGMDPVTGLNNGHTWLRLIDGDHAWRNDGKPRFDTDGVRPAAVLGGKGNFPPWHSTLLRPAFRSLFAGWENPHSPWPFPDLDDASFAAPTDSSNITITITSPVMDSTNYAPAGIVLEAATTDTAGTVRGVDFYQNGTVVGTASAGPPFRYTWHDVSAGCYSVTARAIDDAGATGVRMLSGCWSGLLRMSKLSRSPGPWPT